MKSRKKRYIFGTVIIIGAFVSLVVTSMKSNLRSIPVSQLRAADATPQSFANQHLRVVGFVSHEKLRKSPVRTASGMVQVNYFSVVDKGQRVDVEFRDILPNSFKAGSPVQIDGLYRGDGTLHADHVYTKCPSKYEASDDARREATLGAKADVKS